MRKRELVRPGVDLEESVRLYYQDLYRFALHLTRNAQDAADLTQHAYERLMEKYREVEDSSKVKPWLQATLYRKFIDLKRHSTRFPKVEFDETHPAAGSTFHEAAQRHDAGTALQALLDLEEDLRAPLSLFYLESYSYREIADVLNLPMGTVMSRLHRGKAKLHHHLTQRKS